MSEWINETGPKCFCEGPTSVYLDDDGKAWLLCIFHSYDSGAMFPLPKNGKPDNWPNLNSEELNKIMELGFEENED